MTLPTYVAAGFANNGSTGSVSMTWPTHLTNDIGLIFLETANEAVTIASPAGWAEVANSPQGTGTAGAAGATRLTAFWKRAASASEGVVASGDSGDHQVGQILTVRGCIATGNPIQTSGGDTVASTTTISVPGGITTAADELIVFASSWDTSSTDPGVNAGGATGAGLANITRRGVSGSATDGNGGGFAFWTAEKATAGSFGPMVSAQDNAAVQAHFMLALRSEADSAPIPQITMPPYRAA